MSVAGLIDQFPLLATAPDGVKRLRKLILELAVRGKLVPQDPSDEPASELLKRIQAEKAKLVAEGKIKKDKPLPEIGEDEKPFDLPARWEWTRLGLTGRYINGLAFKPADWGRSGLPIIRIQNLSGRNTDFNFAEREVHDDFIVEPGEMLVSWSATLDVFTWSHESQGVLNQHIFRVAPSDELSHGFLFWLLKHSIRRLAESDHAHGLVMTHINRGAFLGLPIAVPPLAEQHRIVTKVDELMALCDRLEAQQADAASAHATLVRTLLDTFTRSPSAADFAASWQRIVRHFDTLFTTEASIDALKQTVLQLAVMGKLVPQDLNDEDVSALLERVSAERKTIKSKLAKGIDPAGEDLFFSIPDSWCWQPLGSLLTFGPTNGFSPRAVDYETAVRSLTLSATTSGRFNGEHFKFIDLDIPPDSDLWLHDGDILVQRGNTIEYVGVPAVYRGLGKQYIYPDLMMKLRVSSALSVDYMLIAMRHRLARDYLRNRATGSSGTMPKINQTTLSSLPIPLPPLAEQHRIVAKIDELMALCDQLAARLKAARELAAHYATAATEAALEAA